MRSTVSWQHNHKAVPRALHTRLPTSLGPRPPRLKLGWGSANNGDDIAGICHDAFAARFEFGGLIPQYSRITEPMKWDKCKNFQIDEERERGRDADGCG